MSHIEKFWRDATAADVARVMAGEAVVARFRDNESKPWDEGEYLGGWLEGRWKKAGGGSWNYCQVYAPTQWYLDKPEPKFAVGQRVKIVGPPAKGARAICNWSSEMDKYIGGVADVVSVSSMVGDKVFYDLRFIEQWAFREDYLEPVVEPKHYTLQVGDTAETGNGFSLIVTTHGVEVS